MAEYLGEPKDVRSLEELSLEGLSLEPNKESWKNLPLYLRDTGKYLFETAFKLNWGDLSKDCVMDVGCGVDSLQLFKTLFPSFKRVIALDISLSYINYLKFYKAYGRMEYYVGDITDRSTLTEWEEQIPKIVSIYCFNCLYNQRSGFENIHYLLQPGGEAIIITALKNPHYECAKYMFTKNKWEMYKHLISEFTDFNAHGDKGLDYYVWILHQIGFEIVCCTEDFKFIEFPTEKDFKNSEYTQDKIIYRHLPQGIQDEFKEEYLDSLIALNDRVRNGYFCLKTSTAKIVIRKKKA